MRQRLIADEAASPQVKMSFHARASLTSSGAFCRVPHPRGGFPTGDSKSPLIAGVERYSAYPDVLVDEGLFPACSGALGTMVGRLATPDHYWDIEGESL
jgi:hypothetical protein